MARSVLRMAIALVAALAAFTVGLDVRAYQAMSGWAYPASCCSGQDCAEISAHAVSETVDGYIVTVVPGSHPMWLHDRADPLVLAIAYLDSHHSPDGRFHLCIDRTGKPLCFFAAYGGS